MKERSFVYFSVFWLLEAYSYPVKVCSWTERNNEDVDDLKGALKKAGSLRLAERLRTAVDAGANNKESYLNRVMDRPIFLSTKPRQHSL